MRTADGRIQIGDVSNVGPVVTAKLADKEVRAWSVLWYPLASDGTDWHNALKQSQLSGPIAKKVATLSLHHFDISFCERILREHSSKFVDEYNDLTLALWIAVLSKFMSCFQNSKARPRLDPRKVYGANSAALQDFELLLDLRNKHIIHDENSYYNVVAFAWLEPTGDVRIVAPMILVARIDPSHISKICNLVELAEHYL